MQQADRSAPVIVITRPASQAGNLAVRLQQRGMSILRFPVIEIKAIIGNPALNNVIAHLQDYDLAIFVSANAANLGMQAVLAQRNWPAHLVVAAIGQATAQALSDHAHPPSITAPAPNNSESLLGLSQLSSLHGKRVVIFRGTGGREELATVLRERGAQVDYAECYQRSMPVTDSTAVTRAWDDNHRLVFIITSNEGLQNLYNLIPGDYRSKLQSSQLVVISRRAAELAASLGFIQPAIVCAAASDDAMAESLEQLLSTTH